MKLNCLFGKHRPEQENPPFLAYEITKGLYRALYVCMYCGKIYTKIQKDSVNGLVTSTSSKKAILKNIAPEDVENA